MKIISSIKQLQSWSRQTRRKNKTIGFVATMGYLHQGHLSLLRRARKENDFVVLSIFVNPAQFGPQEDFRSYPRDFKRDKKLAKSCGVDVIFAPGAEAMYPAGFKTSVCVGGLGEVLCGKSRPGHFEGVATVVLKLFNLVQPSISYFGQKDAQQAIIIQRMAQDLNLPTRIKVLPIVREPDGLALSSRNKYLDEGQRQNAMILFNSLQAAVGMVKLKHKSPREIVTLMRKMISKVALARVDYISIVDTHDLKEVKKIKGSVLVALAVFFGKTRLIDNVIIKY